MLGKRSILPIIIAIVAYYYYNNIYSKCQKLNSPIIKITTGDIQGLISKSREGREFYEYLGIPYAQPPINELRYELPEPPKSWTGLRETNKLGAECAQFNIMEGKISGNEDCLFLNVFTPKLKIDGKLYPTMVWIHGGLFVSGSSNMYRPDYFMDEDIVLVTINYRLGSLGFLNTGDGVVLGNMGLKDQTMALQWVQQNINKFGGDPSQVTIFGESAGGACVHLHTMSKMSEGLFHRGISQSGVALCPWASMRSNVIAQAERHGKILNCPIGDMKKMVDCLKNKPIIDILEAHRETMYEFRDPITIFGPTLEITNKNSFISENPRDLIRQGKINRVPWIVGMNSHEGLISSSVIVRDEASIKNIAENFNKLIPNFMFYTKENKTSVDSDMNKIQDYYFGKGKQFNKIDNFDNLTNLITDYTYGIPLEESIKLQSVLSPVYPYYYTYKCQFKLVEFLVAMKGEYPAILKISWYLIKKWVNANIFNIHPPNYGPSHAEELAIVFPVSEFTDIRQGHTDYDFSRKMVTLWASFARNITPLNTLGPVWLPQNPKSKELNYLKMDSVGEIITQPNVERLSFWKQLKP